MLSLEKCREFLEDEGRDLSDDDLDRLRREAYGLAEIILECYLDQRVKTAPLPAQEPSEGSHSGLASTAESAAKNSPNVGGGLRRRGRRR
jgi:hypothetical protein